MNNHEVLMGWKCPLLPTLDADATRDTAVPFLRERPHRPLAMLRLGVIGSDLACVWHVARVPPW
jgi:hypothetical protein